MKQLKKLLLVLLSLFFIGIGLTRHGQKQVLSEETAVPVDIDAAKDGPVFGDEEGLQRVKKLEGRLHAMEIRKDHPRIFLTAETLPKIRKTTVRLNQSWQSVLALAEKGDLINAAFAYAILEGVDEKGSRILLNIVKKRFDELDPQVSEDNWGARKDAAVMALAFDWVYNGLTEEERHSFIEKLIYLTRIKERAEKIKNGYKQIFETFHREEWVFHSWEAWPEIALAYHVPEAEDAYKARWNYDWFYGDAARAYAYVADGTPFEGYYYGADGCDWFYALQTATGVNLIDDPEVGWCSGAGYYMLYRLDFGLGREIFHKGAALGTAGILSYRDGQSAWKFKEFLGRSLGFIVHDPYAKWVMEDVSGTSSWGITTTGYSGLEEFKYIANILFDQPMAKELDPQRASYQELPYGRLFPGGREALMRTSFRGASTNAAFTAKPTFTMTSHSDYDVNTFMIYKMGNLAPDSGVYDAYEGQSNYFKYQKNTVAHNNLLIVDPRHPDEPRKLGNTPDPGGVERISHRTFGAVTRFGLTDAFVHDPAADWSKILDFGTTEKYDYVIGDAAKAYSSRLEEYIRTLVFIRKHDNAYIIVFDRVEAKQPEFIKKWLLHLVSEPQMNGRIVQTRVPGHYEIYDADFLSAANVFNTAKLYLKTLLPKTKTVAKIGGDGYEFYVEGSRPTNWPISAKTKEGIERNLGGPWREAGTWRIEVVPQEKKKRDYFLNVMYTCEMAEQLDPKVIDFRETADNVVVFINDEELGRITVTMPKTGQPSVNVSFEERTPQHASLR